MKRILLLPLLLTSLLILGQSPDEILKAHFKAINQKELNKVTSFRMSGSLYQMGVEIPMEVLQERPNKIRTSGSYMGMQFVQTCNGTTGWSLNPFAGQSEATPITGEELTSLKRQADMDGMLYHYSEKGNSIRVLEPELIDSLLCNKLELTTSDSLVYEYLFDPNTNYCILMRTQTMVQGRMSTVESVFSDFRNVEGVIFASSVETRIDGMTALRIHFDEYILNEDLDDGLFEKP